MLVGSDEVGVELSDRVTGDPTVGNWVWFCGLGDQEVARTHSG